MRLPISPQRFVVLIAFVILAGAGLRATTCTAISNGNWTDPATWSCGRPPATGDTIWIPLGFTVNVDINSPTYEDMLVVVDGILNFENGMKLNICPGGVYVSETGWLTGGTPGSKINICGSTVWNGPGPTGGPLTFGSVTLPVELITFTGELNSDNQVLLSWRTATEKNNDFFTVERSVNGLTFEAIGTVSGNGTSSQPHDYTFTDPSPAEGTNYYRLRQTDFNGRSETFNIVAVDYITDEGECVLSVHPNPCVEQCIINFSGCPSDKDGTILVEMIDANGAMVSSSVHQQASDGSFTMQIDTGNNLKPGMYIIRGTSSKTSYVQKAVLK